MLQIQGFSKKYKNSKKVAVKEMNLQINDGEMVGFLGKNGAGKSTTIKCITGVMPYDTGTIKINGYDLKTNPIEAKRLIGYVPDNYAIYETLTGREYVNYLADIYEVEEEERANRLETFAEKLSLTYALDQQISTYSHGMKQKICLIGSLIHNPKFWILDEPLVGLDPQSASEIREIMREHTRMGNSIFFSSHNIDLVEKLCNRVVIIDEGEIIEDFDVDTYRSNNLDSLEEFFFKRTNSLILDEDKRVIIRKDYFLYSGNYSTTEKIELLKKEIVKLKRDLLKKGEDNQV